MPLIDGEGQLGLLGSYSHGYVFVLFARCPLGYALVDMMFGLYCDFVHHIPFRNTTQSEDQMVPWLLVVVAAYPILLQ